MKSNILYIFLLCILLISCGDEADDPVYVTVNQPNFSINNTQGSDFQSIQEYFMFHRTSLLGGFSYEHEIPVLASGQEDLLIFAGIRKNTLIEQPAIYTMMAPDTLRRNFVPGEMTSFTPTFKYYDNTKFRLLEDFESGTQFTMDIDQDDETILLAVGGEGYQGSFGGVMEVNSDNPLLIVGSQALTDFPLSGDIILEMTFKTNTILIVGIYAINNFDQNDPRPKVNLLPTDDWTKVYIDLSQEINQNRADAYRVFFSINHLNSTELTTSRAVVDDIKLLHR